MSTRGFVDSPTFYSNVELSATDLNDLANNLQILDAASRRKFPTHYIARTTGVTPNGFGEIVEGNWLWRGGFQYRVGMTHARIVVVINAAPGMVASNQFQVLMNDVVAHQQAITTPGTFNIDIPISSRGYVDYQVITVVCRVSVVNPFPNERIVGEVYVRDAYVYPLDTISIGTNPTLTTFGNLTETRLNDLSNKIDYLMNRMSLVPIIPHHAFIQFQLIGFGIWTQNHLYTKINLGTNGSHIRLSMYWFVWSPSTRMQITINGVTREYGPYTPGQIFPSGGVLEIPATEFSLTANTDYIMRIRQVVNVEGRGTRNDRLVLTAIEITNPSEPAITSLAANAMLESIQFSNLQTRLNTYVSLANTINSTITSNPAIWNRAQMFRARMAHDEFQNNYWEDELRHRFIRAGDILWVKGRNIQLTYGVASMKPIKGDEEELEITSEYEQKLTNDNVETKIFYLDQFEALYPGTEYFLTGDVQYAAEYLR